MQAFWAENTAAFSLLSSPLVFCAFFLAAIYCTCNFGEAFPSCTCPFVPHLFLMFKSLPYKTGRLFEVLFLFLSAFLLPQFSLTTKDTSKNRFPYHSPCRPVVSRKLYRRGERAVFQRYVLRSYPIHRPMRTLALLRPLLTVERFILSSPAICGIFF